MAVDYTVDACEKTVLAPGIVSNGAGVTGTSDVRLTFAIYAYFPGCSD